MARYESWYVINEKGVLCEHTENDGELSTAILDPEAEAVVKLALERGARAEGVLKRILGRDWTAMTDEELDAFIEDVKLLPDYSRAKKLSSALKEARQIARECMECCDDVKKRHSQTIAEWSRVK